MTLLIVTVHFSTIVKECYSMKLDLPTNVTIVDDAIRFVLTNGQTIQSRF